jgi:WD40 repeat protein
VTITPDGKRAISASDDKSLRLWDLESGAQLRTFEGHTGSVNSVAISPNGLRAISASDDKSLRLWDLTSGSCLLLLNSEAPFYSVAITSNGKLILAGDSAGAVHFIAIHNFK